MRVLTSILLISLLAGCAQQNAKQGTQYNVAGLAPVETDNFILLRQHTYDQPELGVGYRYMDKKYTDDLIDVYFYPVQTFDWSDQKTILHAELNRTLKEIDYLVRNGKYDASRLLDKSEFVFLLDGDNYSGVRAKMALDRMDHQLLSYVYLFIEKDKYVKFRVSFDANLSPDWSGDALVKELLPQFNVPGESDYMRHKRAEQKARYEETVKQQVLNIIERAND